MTPAAYRAIMDNRPATYGTPEPIPLHGGGSLLVTLTDRGPTRIGVARLGRGTDIASVNSMAAALAVVSLSPGEDLWIVGDMLRAEWLAGLQGMRECGE